MLVLLARWVFFRVEVAGFFAVAFLARGLVASRRRAMAMAHWWRPQTLLAVSTCRRWRHTVHLALPVLLAATRFALVLRAGVFFLPKPNIRGSFLEGGQRWMPRAVSQ